MSCDIPPPPPAEVTDLALCAEVGSDLFFSAADGGRAAVDARRICRRCEVQDECLAYAVEHELPCGVWGGMSPKERRPLVRAHRARELDEAIAALAAR